MTEKRFKLYSEVGFIDTQKCGGDTMTLFEVVVELNKLNEENEKLKQNCKNYEWYKQYKELLNENELLKIRFKEERDTAMKLGSECDNLTIKNRKLELEILRLETIIKTGEKND